MFVFCVVNVLFDLATRAQSSRYCCSLDNIQTIFEGEAHVILMESLQMSRIKSHAGTTEATSGLWPFGQTLPIPTMKTKCRFFILQALYVGPKTVFSPGTLRKEIFPISLYTKWLFSSLLTNPPCFFPHCAFMYLFKLKFCLYISSTFVYFNVTSLLFSLPPFHIFSPE